MDAIAIAIVWMVIVVQIMIIWDDDLKGCCRGVVWNLDLGMRSEDLDVVLMKREKGRCGVEIGGDTAAFLSDLSFRFLMMHLVFTSQSTQREMKDLNLMK